MSLRRGRPIGTDALVRFLASACPSTGPAAGPWPWPTLRRLARPSILLMAVMAVSCGIDRPAVGQYRTPSTYADYYQRELQQRTAPTVNPARYTYDRVFYHNPAVSPYTNLLRAQGPLSAPNYFRYVVPEQQRRQNVEMQMSKPRGTGGLYPSVTGGGLPGPYHNHWYGSRQAMGLP